MFRLLRIVLTVVGAIIMLDCLILMTADKLNFGTIVPLLIGTVFVAHGLGWPRIRAKLARNTLLRRVWYALWTLFVLWLISFGAFALILQQRIEASRGAQPPVAAMIVLGSGTVAGKPSSTLASRLDAAADLASRQPHALIITSGGIGLGQTRSEADIMATYLQQTHGIPQRRIHQEGKSTSTEENLAYSQPILAQQGIDKNAAIAIVTSDFHTIRAAAIAQHQGFTHVHTVASETPLSIRYNAWFREYFAFVSGWLLNEY